MATRMLELMIAMLFMLGIALIFLKIMRSPNTENRFRVDDQGEEPWQQQQRPTRRRTTTRPPEEQ